MCSTIWAVTDSSGRGLLFSYQYIYNAYRITEVTGYDPDPNDAGTLDGLDIVYNYDEPAPGAAPGAPPPQAVGNLTSVVQKDRATGAILQKTAYTYTAGDGPYTAGVSTPYRQNEKRACGEQQDEQRRDLDPQIGWVRESVAQEQAGGIEGQRQEEELSLMLLAAPRAQNQHPDGDQPDGAVELQGMNGEAPLRGRADQPCPELTEPRDAPVREGDGPRQVRWESMTAAVEETADLS